MAYSVLLGIADAAVASQAAALVGEETDLEVIGAPVRDASDVMAAIDSSGADVVLLHEDIGPLPVMDLAKEITGRWPHVGVVLVVRDRTPEVLRAALQAGARDVLALPLSFEELIGVKGAGAWSHTVRDQVLAGRAAAMTFGVGGRMIAVAGAKGGVGATTVSVHLALEAAGARRGRSVCLVDLDLQAGDVGLLLDLTHRRSIADLLDVAHELSPRVFEDALYVHQSGLRVLLAPEAGEQEEDVGAPAARRILGALKSNFDVVIVDVGTTVTEANAVAVDMADQVLVVTTPDVPALRAVNRLLGLWERLDVKGSDVAVVLNRVNRDAEVQPDLVKKVVDAPVAKTVIPSGWRELEPAANTGVPARLGDGGLRSAFGKLARESGAAPAEDARPKARSGREAGQVAVETIGIFFLFLLVAALLWEIVLVGVTYVMAGHAARSGAEVMNVGGSSHEIEAVAREEVIGAWRDGMEVEVDTDGAFVEVSLPVPVAFPGVQTSFRIEGRAGGVVEEEGALPLLPGGEER